MSSGMESNWEDWIQVGKGAEQRGCAGNFAGKGGFVVSTGDTEIELGEVRGLTSSDELQENGRMVNVDFL